MTVRQISISELEAAFAQELPISRRAAAETAYALAHRYRSEDVDGRRRFDIAGEWARRTVDLLAGLPSASVADVTSTRASVGGVEIPDLLHDDVVRSRLADVLVL